MSQQIYLDHAATTPVAAQALEAMIPYCRQLYGNPSSSYALAQDSRQAVEEARDVIAGAIGAKSHEIYFTAGGTESDNWAVKMSVFMQKQDREAKPNASEKKHLITTKIEHHAILHACEWMEQQGYEVTYLPVDEQGVVSVRRLKEAIRPDTACISIMYANNEVGTIQPIREIGAIAAEHGIPFHTDAVQAFCQIPIDVKEQKISLLSASSHKCYGPKGVGFFYIYEQYGMPPFMHGGAQERQMRAGTENVPGIVGFAKAVAICQENMEERMQRERALRDYLIQRILTEIPYVRLNGYAKNRLPGNANFCFQFVEGEHLLVLLDMDGICASAGSACTTGSSEPSHVLTAMGLPRDLANGALRLTLGAHTTKDEIDVTVEAIKRHVEQLRSTSSWYLEFTGEQPKCM